MQKAPNYKTAVVCMVYNGYEYLGEFLHYHLNLCDHLYIIDHNSQRDLRQFEMERVTFIRSNHEAQFQSECTNLVIEHYGIKDKFDWLFVLDIDEFLPFKTRAEFQDFLHAHRRDNVLKFHWNNGVPFFNDSEAQPQSLIDCKSIRFFHKPGRQYKSAVNIRKTKGLFFVPTGAHTICRILTKLRAMTPVLKNRKDYIPAPAGKELFHVVAFDKITFVAKIKNYVRQMEYRAHVAKQGGGVVRDYPEEYTDDEWLRYIGNFRVTDPAEFYEVKAEYFVQKDIFAHLDEQAVRQTLADILALGKTDKKPSTVEEQKYLRYKTNDRDVMENIKWFRISPENEIYTVIPDEHR